MQRLNYLRELANKKNGNAKKKTIYHYTDFPMQCRNNDDNLSTVLYTTVLGLTLRDFEEQIHDYS